MSDLVFQLLLLIDRMAAGCCAEYMGSVYYPSIISADPMRGRGWLAEMKSFYFHFNQGHKQESTRTISHSLMCAG